MPTTTLVIYMLSTITVTVQHMTGDLMIFTQFTAQSTIGVLKHALWKVECQTHPHTFGENYKSALHLITQDMMDFRDDPLFEFVELLHACDQGQPANAQLLCDGETYRLFIAPSTYTVEDLFAGEITMLHSSTSRYLIDQLGIIRLLLQGENEWDRLYLNLAYSHATQRFRHYHESYFRMDNSYSCSVREKEADTPWFDTIEECLDSIAESRCMGYLIGASTIQNILHAWEECREDCLRHFQSEIADMEEQMDADELHR